MAKAGTTYAEITRVISLIPAITGIVILYLVFLLPLILLLREYSPRVSPWKFAIVLNALGLAVPFGGYLGPILILLWCFISNALIASICPRWGWFSGALSSTLFLVPYYVWWAFNASPDQVAVFGYVLWNVIGLSILSGSLGSLLGIATRVFLDWRVSKN